MGKKGCSLGGYGILTHGQNTMMFSSLIPSRNPTKADSLSSFSHVFGLDQFWLGHFGSNSLRKCPVDRWAPLVANHPIFWGRVPLLK